MTGESTSVPLRPKHILLEHFLEIKAGQAAAGLLRIHGLGRLGADLPESALSIKPERRSLNLGRAQYHLFESERARFGQRMIEHALGNAHAAVALVEIHAAKLSVVGPMPFDAKATDDFIGALDDPEGVASGFGEDV